MTTVSELLRLGQHEQAEALAREALAQSPESAQCHASLAHVLAAAKRTAEALEYTVQAVQLAPRDAGLRLLEARLQFQLKRYESARQTTQTGVVLEAWAHQTFYRDSLLTLQGACLLNLRQPGLARSVLSAAAPGTRVFAGELLKRDELLEAAGRQATSATPG